MFVKIILTILWFGQALGGRTEDPLCVGKVCRGTQFCRVVKDCSESGYPCTLEARCLEPVTGSHTSVCQVGYPILVISGSSWADLTCGPGIPCPESAYCNTELMDTYATCCRSDPTNGVKPGVCPVYTIASDFYSVDNCNNDGDCRHDYKCCNQGSRKECSRPI